MIKDELGLLMSEYKVAKEELTIKRAAEILGKKNLFKGIVSRIENCRSNLDFGFEGGAKALEQDDYVDLFMPEHWLEIPKSEMTDQAYEFIMKRYLVPEIIVTESSYIFYIIAEEGPIVHEVSDVIVSINKVLVPYLNESLGSVNIYNFKVLFLIMKFY